MALFNTWDTAKDAKDDVFLPALLKAFGKELAARNLISPTTLARCLPYRMCGIDFLYSVIDSGSGRELQNQPIHNIAGLGEPLGERPFRTLAKPMIFMPRSTIRIEIIEQSEGEIFAGGRLYFVLHGYKILGYGTGPS